VTVRAPEKAREGAAGLERTTLGRLLGFGRCADAPANEGGLYRPALKEVLHFTTSLAAFGVKDAADGGLFAYRSERISLGGAGLYPG